MLWKTIQCRLKSTHELIQIQVHNNSFQPRFELEKDSSIKSRKLDVITGNGGSGRVKGGRRRPYDRRRRRRCCRRRRRCCFRSFRGYGGGHRKGREWDSC